jgi:hypothetical protein
MSEPRRREGGTERTMVVVGFAIVLVVGGGAILVRYGATSAGIAAGVIAGGAGLLIGLYALLAALERWARSE